MRRALARAVPTVAAAALLAGSVVWSPAPAAARQPVAPVTMSVVDVSPNTPQVSSKPQPLTFTLQLVNHTEQSMKVTVSAARSDPIGSSDGLDSAIAHPKPPSPDQISPLTASATTQLAPAGSAGATGDVTIATTTDVSPHDGVCLCANLIYPFWFIASYTGRDASGSVTAQTFVPSFTTKPVKNTVSWVWPLFDRPHRLLQSRIFFDDALAKEISGGRLDRLLQVIEQLPKTVPITIMTDPELIAELAEMAQGYKVTTPRGPKDGTGTDAAKAWLSRFRAALDAHPQDSVEFTPFADPAVDSLTRAKMGWPIALGPHEQALVTDALGGRTPPSNLAWPVGRSLSPDTLDALAKQGANTVIVSDTSLSEGDVQPVPNALAPAPTTTDATLAVTSAPVERLVNETLDPTGNGLGVLPELVSQLAVRVEADLAAKTNTGRYVVITPARYLDVDPGVAVRTIEATADTTWSRPITIEQAVGDKTNRYLGPSRGTLRDMPSGPRLGHRLLHEINHVSNQLPLLNSMFRDPTRPFSAFPTAIQRCESTSLISDPSVAFAMVRRLRQIMARTQHSVYIVRPSDGTYTLTSKSSQLPITVVNKLNSEVDVELSVNPVSGESGLSATSSPQGYTIKANSKVQVHVLTHVDRVGLIGAVVRISTPGGLPLGRPVRLSVRSTALGAIGVIITVLAAILLVVAVVIRHVRRLRRRAPRTPDEPTPVAATTASTT